MISDDVGNDQCQCFLSKFPHHADGSWYHDLSQLGHFIGAAALGVVSIAGSSFRSEAERSRLLQGSRVPPPPRCLFLKDADVRELTSSLDRISCSWSIAQSSRIYVLALYDLYFSEIL